MVFTDVKKVRQATNGQLTTTKVSDEDLNKIILDATATINNKINVEVKEELVRFIDNTRKNRVTDGTTTTFYVRSGIINYLADNTNDGTVNTSDVRVFKVDNEGTRTELTVNAVDVEDGSFTLSTTPGTDTRYLYVWYAYSFYNVNTPDRLIELLTTYLSASYAYLQKDHALPNRTKFGNIEISRAQGSTSYLRYNQRYLDLLKQVIIPSNKPPVRTYKDLI